MDTHVTTSILVVDDVYINRALLIRTLQTLGNTLEAENGQEALNILRKRKSEISVVILDLNMPVLDGYGVLRAMASDPELQQIPVVVVTAVHDEESQIRVLEMGTMDIIGKPFNPRIVQTRVRNILLRRDAELVAKQNEIFKLRLEQQDRLIQVLDYDELTGIFNKRAFARRVRAMLNDNPGVEYTIVRLDIDRFRVYNEIFGAKAGDRLLRDIAVKAGEMGISDSVYAHFEADHFVWCIPGDKLDMDDFTARVAGWFDKKKLKFDITMRFGIYVITDASMDIETMCDRALIALRSVKGNGTQNVGYYDEKLREHLIEEQNLLSEINSAFDDEQFIIYFQPQYDYSKNELIGAEALVRWKHPERGIISPGIFIPIMEKNGIITKLDEYVWEKSCAYLSSWYNKYGRERKVSVSVNLSRVDIYRQDICEFFCDLTDKYGVPRELFKLEITESAYMEDADQLIETVKKLQSLGFSVEMDDFGSGYSSLNTLKDVPVDILKLDMKFLTGAINSERGGNILSSIIRMARWLKLPVIAEGIETKEQAEYLKTIGCFFMQGFFFAKPMPAEEFEKLITQVGVADKKEQYNRVDTTAASQFWDASTMTTLVFNSFIGGAAVLERRNDSLEFLRTNDKFYTELRTTREEYHQWLTRIRDRLYPEDLRKIDAMLDSVSNSEDEGMCEIVSPPMKKSGTTNYLRIKAKLLTKFSDSDTFYLTIENITDKKQLEDKNKELVSGLHSVIDSIPGGIMNIVTDGTDIRIDYYNSYVLELFGYDRNEYEKHISGSFTSLIHREDLGEVLEGIKCAVASGKAISVSFRVKTGNGALTWFGAVGKVISKTGTYSVISVLLNPDNKQNYDKYRLMIERTNAAIIQCDYVNGEIFYSNEYFKYANRIEQGRTVKERHLGVIIVHEDDSKELDSLTKAIEAKKNLASAEVRLMMKDGSYSWTHITCVAIKNEEGRLIKTVTTLTDIDELKRVKLSLDEISSRLSDVVANVPAGIGIIEVDTEFIPVFVSDRLCTMFGYTREEYDERIRNRKPLNFMPDISVLDPEQWQRFINGSTEEVRMKAVKKDGTEFWVRIVAGMVKKDNGVTLCYGTVFDMTRNMMNSRRNTWQLERYRLICETEDYRTFDYSPEEDKMTISVFIKGEKKELIIEEYLADFENRTMIIPQDREAFLTPFRELLTERGERTVVCNAVYDGKRRRYEMKLVSVTDRLARVCRIVARLDDIEDKYNSLEELRHQAEYDEATGLINKDTAYRRITGFLAAPRSASGSIDVLLIADIDNFKAVNDSFGHAVGDNILREFADILKKNLRKEDLVARYGGDEFIIYMSSVEDMAVAERRAAEIIEVTRSIFVENSFNLECSIGLAEVFFGESFENCFRRADSALYTSKRTGKNRYSVYKQN